MMSTGATSRPSEACRTPRPDDEPVSSPARRRLRAGAKGGGFNKPRDVRSAPAGATFVPNPLPKVPSCVDGGRRMVRTSTAAALPRLLVLTLAVATAGGHAEARAHRHHHRGHHHHARVSKPHHRGHQAVAPADRASTDQDGAARAEFLRTVMAKHCSGFRTVAAMPSRDGHPEAQSPEQIRWRALFEKEPETACKAAELLLYGRATRR